MKVYYMGVDLHKRFCQIAVMDQEGEILDERRIANDEDLLREYFQQVPSGTQVAVESSSSWYWLSDLLEECGLKMHLSHPLKTRLIASSRIKTDRIDARSLAQLLRTGFLPLCYIPCRAQRELKHLIRYRIFLVRLRTKVKNAIHNLLSSQNIPIPGLSDLFGKRGRAFLQAVRLSALARQRLNGHLELLDVLGVQIKELDQEVRSRAKEDERAQLLMSIPGIGYFSALTILSEIGEIGRFSSAKHLVSYAGLNPVVRASGEHIHRGHISRQGSRILRWILVECAQVTIRRSRAFHSFHRRIKERKGYNLATVATARKLLEVIYHILRDKNKYDEKLVNRHQVRVSPFLQLAR